MAYLGAFGSRKSPGKNKGEREPKTLFQKKPRKSFGPPKNNTITAKGTELEFIKEVVIDSLNTSLHSHQHKNGIDDLRLVDIKCGQMSIKAVIDTGAQISVLREDLIGKGCGEGEGTIQIISAFGEKEIAALKLFNLKIDDGKHGSVPIMCAVSKKLRDFESTKDKDIEFRKETENETRIREARHKEEEQARLKAEVEARLEAENETKAVEERRRMNERVALEEEMRLKKERWLVEEQIRHVQEEHKMRMKEEQKCLPEERCASSLDGCFSNGEKSNTPLNHHVARSVIK
ncbi:retrovirus-related Pol polyprotein from transposon opus [Trichonephila inaurata madagascariensis]|uniref:Retrovirus-related Pol polyprotein from transposon opus n=1 Tax=Trichonephila inaurata madagascariensis TaxID=2747483 RepID=A0A8X6YJY1_9ARAC|nr:retrovirus-related Pol polyprotein from transposon opus [Trichonephila inaurata madagascariensis]